MQQTERQAPGAWGLVAGLNGWGPWLHLWYLMGASGLRQEKKVSQRMQTVSCQDAHTYTVLDDHVKLTQAEVV